jgi:hypothetical protein
MLLQIHFRGHQRLGAVIVGLSRGHLKLRLNVNLSGCGSSAASGLGRAADGVFLQAS